MSTPTPALVARAAAGYGGRDGLKRLCRELRVSPGYYRKFERHGCAPHKLAHRFAILCDCSVETLYLSAACVVAWNSNPDAMPRDLLLEGRTESPATGGRQRRRNGMAAQRKLARVVCRTRRAARRRFSTEVTP